MFFQKALLTTSLAISFCVGIASTHAETINQIGARKAISIANNSGGSIIEYAIDVADYRSAGTLVKFSGRCDSACTLFLGLPSRQTCISHGAYFRFHAPSAASARSEKMAQAYLMQKYPGWVKAWIGRNNGLNRNLITMDYSYASKFMRSCDAIASR